MPWFIASLLLPIPLAHLWLHALLPFWKRHKVLFYLSAIVLWVASYFWIKAASGFSPLIFTPNEIMVVIGYVMMFAGFIMAIWSFATLGLKRFFVLTVLDPDSFAPIVRIDTGAFRHFPHPAYIGYLIVAVGNLLSSGALYLGAVLMILMFFTPIVIWFEERELEERLED